MAVSINQDPIIVPPGGGHELIINDGNFIHKVDSKDTNGVFSVLEIVTPSGGGMVMCKDIWRFPLEWGNGNIYGTNN